MGLIIINSPGLATSNAYISLASCSNILLMDVHKTDNWASLSTTDQTANIIYGTFLLDVQIQWVGYKTDSDQRLDWPREGVYDKNDDDVDEDTIPEFLQTATSFYAYFLSQEDRTSDETTAGFKSIKAGSLAMVIDKYDRTPTMPHMVWDILRPYGTKMSGIPRTLERK